MSELKEARVHETGSSEATIERLTAYLRELADAQGGFVIIGIIPAVGSDDPQMKEINIMSNIQFGEPLANVLMAAMSDVMQSKEAVEDKLIEAGLSRGGKTN